MTKPKDLSADAERELEWLRAGGALGWLRPDTTIAWDHYEVFLQALPSSWLRRRAAIKRYVRVRDRVLRKFERDVKALAKLERAYLACLRNDPHKRPTQPDLARAIAQADGKDVDDPDSFDEIDGARGVRAILKRLGVSWPKFVRFAESSELQQASELEN